MSFVVTAEFVAALKTIGVEIPENARRATIVLDPDDVVRIECELLMQRFTDTTTIHDRTRSVACRGVEKVTKRFRLVEEPIDPPPPLADVGGIICRGI